MQKKVTELPATRASSPWQGFLGKEGLYEGILGLKERLRMNTLLSAAARGEHKNGNIDDAATVYHGLSQIQQRKTLDSIDSKLAPISLSASPTQKEIAEAEVLTEFVSRTIAHPSIDPGDESHEGIMERLASIAKDKVLSSEPDCERLRISCIRALWKMGYKDQDFWSRMLEDERTRGFSIMKLLGSEHFDGWSILKMSLRNDAIGVSVADSTSARNADFILHALSDADTSVVVSALRASIYLEPEIPALYDMVSRLSYNSEDANAVKAAMCAMEIMDIKRGMVLGEAAWLQGAEDLLSMYRNGDTHLHTMLMRIGMQTDQMPVSHDDSMRKTMLMLSLNVSGISVPGSQYSMDFDD